MKYLAEYFTNKFYKTIKAFCMNLILLQNLLILKINESLYIELFVVRGSIKKLFSIDCVNGYLSQSIVNYLSSMFFQ